MVAARVCPAGEAGAVTDHDAVSEEPLPRLDAVPGVVGVTVQPDGALRPRLTSLTAPGPRLASVALTVVVFPDVVTRLLDGLTVSWVAAGSADCTGVPPTWVIVTGR